MFVIRFVRRRQMYPWIFVRALAELPWKDGVNFANRRESPVLKAKSMPKPPSIRAAHRATSSNGKDFRYLFVFGEWQSSETLRDS